MPKTKGLKRRFTDLTQWRPIFRYYRNQPIDLNRKSIDWFLQVCNIALKQVDTTNVISR